MAHSPLGTKTKLCHSSTTCDVSLITTQLISKIVQFRTVVLLAHNNTVQTNGNVGGFCIDNRQSTNAHLYT